jgi:hypothetical protein
LLVYTNLRALTPPRTTQNDGRVGYEHPQKYLENRKLINSHFQKVSSITHLRLWMISLNPQVPERKLLRLSITRPMENLMKNR